MQRCERIQRLIDGYLDGKLSKLRRHRVERHLGTCATCRGDLESSRRVQRAVDHLVSVIDENGWRCVASPDLGKFKGPGRRSDPCPIVNVYALKALSLAPGRIDSPAAHSGAEMLLWHWEHQKDRKLYLFGIGTDFRKLKYPFVWYDILHVVDVLSQIDALQNDERLNEMLDVIVSKQDSNGRFTPESVWMAFKGWDFGQKKIPSPWMTFLVARILKRMHL